MNGDSFIYWVSVVAGTAAVMLVTYAVICAITWISEYRPGQHETRSYALQQRQALFNERLQQSREAMAILEQLRKSSGDLR